MHDGAKCSDDNRGIDCGVGMGHEECRNNTQRPAMNARGNAGTQEFALYYFGNSAVLTRGAYRPDYPRSANVLGEARNRAALICLDVYRCDYGSGQTKVKEMFYELI